MIVLVLVVVVITKPDMMGRSMTMVEGEGDSVPGAPGGGLFKVLD